LNDPEVIRRLELEFYSTFKELSLDMDTIENRDNEGGLNWLDEDGDVGVTEWKDKTVDDIRAQLGLPSEEDMPDFPFLNRHYSPVGKDLVNDASDFPGYDPKNTTDEEAESMGLLRLKPHWHQWVGLAAMVSRGFEGKNVILADGVGVGKTLQCFMLIAYLRFLEGKTRVIDEACTRPLPPIGEQSRCQKSSFDSRVFLMQRGEDHTGGP